MSALCASYASSAKTARIMCAVAVIVGHAAMIVAAEVVTTEVVVTANARVVGHPAAKIHAGRRVRRDHHDHDLRVRAGHSLLVAANNQTARSKLPMAHITMHAANAVAITKAANATKMRAKTIARNLRSYRALKKKWACSNALRALSCRSSCARNLNRRFQSAHAEFLKKRIGVAQVAVKAEAHAADAANPAVTEIIVAAVAAATASARSAMDTSRATPNLATPHRFTTPGGCR